MDDLFEISKLESDHVDIKKEKFALSEVLSDILMKFELGAGKKSVELSLDVPKEPLYVEADLAMIDRAIQNLLDNALKHTPSGGKIRIAVRKQNNRQVDVMVEDTGVGIPQDDLPFIFDRYKKARDNTRAGSGLGLAIARSIVRAHGGDIRVRSEAGETAFECRFSRSAARSAAATERERSRAGAAAGAGAWPGADMPGPATSIKRRDESDGSGPAARREA